MTDPRMAEKVRQCEDIIGYRFTEPQFCWEALQQAGSGALSTRAIPDGNKRLAILGDQVLDIILVEQWYTSGAPKGQWARTRLEVSSNENIEHVGRLVGLDSCIQVNPQNPVTISRDMMTAAVEAVIGAVFLDGGLDAAREVANTLGLSY